MDMLLTVTNPLKARERSHTFSRMIVFILEGARIGDFADGVKVDFFDIEKNLQIIQERPKSMRIFRHQR
jgi:hypothetical protein